MRRPHAIALVAAALVLAGTADGCRGGASRPLAGGLTSPSAATPASAPATGPATLHGTLTLDGAPLATRFLGARVLRNGLAAACQTTIPAVAGGAYELTVASAAEVRGCGVPGAEVLLWAYVGGAYVYALGTAPWPGDGARATFDVAFSSATPAGASEPVTEFKGRIRDAAGAPLPDGTVVEAYVGGTLCGATSLRSAAASDGYITMIVAGPASVPACAAGATVSFRLGGRPAAQTIVNAPGTTITHDVDLSLAP